MVRQSSVLTVLIALIGFTHMLHADAMPTDVTTGCPAVLVHEKVETPTVGPLRQHSVLWDTTHGTYLNYVPSIRYSTLLANLADSGYTVDYCGTGVHTVDLMQYDVVLINLVNNWNSAYTAEEVDSLVSFYDQDNQRVLLTGDMNFCENMYLSYADNVPFIDNVFDWLSETGGILIMGDNLGCPNVNINPIANAFHMTAGISNLTPTDLYFSNFALHPVFNGIDTVYYRAAGDVAATTPAEPIAWTVMNLPTVAALDEAVGIAETPTITANYSHLKIGPNPFLHSTEIKGIEPPTEIRIFDVTGRLTARQTSNIVGQNLKEGVYFVYIDGFQPEKIVKIK
ncbi:MAG: T9SS type A sorting domain-containing protein [candidate division WOR-3 bacterium]|nr:MAG: T9SS type A sorting domain-containing protein [candidate division WOR-3 bacterium]